MEAAEEADDVLPPGIDSAVDRSFGEAQGPGSARITTAGAMDRSTQEGFTELTGDAGCSTREPQRRSDASG